MGLFNLKNVPTAKEAGILKIENRGNGVFHAHYDGGEVKKFMSYPKSTWGNQAGDFACVRYKSAVLQYVATLYRGKK